MASYKATDVKIKAKTENSVNCAVKNRSKYQDFLPYMLARTVLHGNITIVIIFWKQKHYKSNDKM